MTTNAEQLLIDPETQRPLMLHMRAAALARGDTAAVQAAGLIMQTATSAAIAVLVAYEGAAKLPESSYAAVVAQLDEPLPEPIEVPPPEPAAIQAPRRPPTFSRSPSPPSGAGRPAAARLPAFPKQPPSQPRRPPQITGPDAPAMTRSHSDRLNASDQLRSNLTGWR